MYATLSVFFDLLLAVVVFFGTLGGGIESEMATTRLQSSLDEEIEMKGFISLFGEEMVPIGGIFVLSIIIAL